MYVHHNNSFRFDKLTYVMCLEFIAASEIVIYSDSATEQNIE
jgi:hypothetical protein